MAEGYVNDKILEDDFLTCQICLEIYKEPKILKCLHSFCETCLAQCITKMKSGVNVTCPLCREVSNLPQSGVTSLKSNFYIKNLIDFINTTCNINRCQWHCSYCEISGKGRVNATAKCISCSDFLCQTCTGNHNGTRMTMNHQIVSISDLTMGKYNSQVRSKQTIQCSVHEDESLRYLCESCNVPVCRNCVLLDHRQHNCVQISEAVKTRRGEIEETLKSLDKRLECMKDSKQTFDEKLKELSTKELSYIEQVQQTTEVVIQKAREECKMTKQLIKEKFIEPKKYVQDLKTAMETKTKDLDDSLNFCRKVIQDGRDSEILFLLETMKERLTALQNVEDDKEYLSSQMDVPVIHLTENFRSGEPPCIFHIQCRTTTTHSTNQTCYAHSKDNESKLRSVQEVFTNPVMCLPLAPSRPNRKHFVFKLVRKIDRIQKKEKFSPKITCVFSEKNNTFYAVDCNNSKLNLYSFSGDCITSINVNNVITAAECESCLICGTLDGKISTVSENGAISDTTIPMLHRTSPMCSTRDNKAIIVMATDRFFRITKNALLTIHLKFQGKHCHISPKFLSNFKNSQYIVSDWESNSLHFIKGGGTIYKDYCHDDKDWSPGAVTTDNSDYIYVICYHQCSLQILNPDAQYVQTINLKPNVSCPRGLSFVGDGRLVIVGRNGINLYDVECVRK